MEIFCIRLKELRLERKVKQLDLGKTIHVAHNTISSWERGRTFPNLEELSQLADFFDVSTDYLLGRDDI